MDDPGRDFARGRALPFSGRFGPLPVRGLFYHRVSILCWVPGALKRLEVERMTNTIDPKWHSEATTYIMCLGMMLTFMAQPLVSQPSPILFWIGVIVMISAIILGSYFSFNLKIAQSNLQLSHWSQGHFLLCLNLKFALGKEVSFDEKQYYAIVENEVALGPNRLLLKATITEIDGVFLTESEDKFPEFIVLCYDQYLQKIQTPNPFILPILSTSCRPFAIKPFTVYMPYDKKNDLYGKVTLPGGYIAGSATWANRLDLSDPIRGILHQLSENDPAFKHADWAYEKFLVINVTDGPFRSVAQIQEPPFFGTPAFEWLFQKKEE